MNPFNLYEAYAAVYDEDLRDELEVIDEDLSFIDDLTDNELTQIMEEILRDGEVGLNECFDAFEGEVITEAESPARARKREAREAERKAQFQKATRPARARGRLAMQRLSQATSRAAENIRSGAESAKAKAGGAISALAGGAAEAGRKGKAAAQHVGGKLAAAKERISKFVQAQGKRIGDAKQQAHVGLAKYASRRNLMPGAGLKTRSSKGRSELRGAVASDVAQRASGRVGREVEKAKSGVKGLLRRGAEKVAQKASSFAQRMSEEIELVIPYILEDLVQEGYARDYNEALNILESMSDYEVGELAESYLVEEDFEAWVDGLWEEGYDLSDYTWEGLYEAYFDEALTGPRGKRALMKFKDQNLRPNWYKRPGDSKNPKPDYTLGAVARHKEGSPNPYNPSTPEDYVDSGNRPTKRGGRGKKGEAKTGYYGTDRRDSDRGRGNAARRRMGLPESYDAYDEVLNYLLDEGYAETVEDATTIMANMSEEWRDEILEAKIDTVVDKQLKQVGVSPETRRELKRGGRQRRNKPEYSRRTPTQVKLAHRRSVINDRDYDYPVRGTRRGAESPTDR